MKKTLSLILAFSLFGLVKSAPSDEVNPSLINLIRGNQANISDVRDYCKLTSDMNPKEADQYNRRFFSKFINTNQINQKLLNKITDSCPDYQ